MISAKQIFQGLKNDVEWAEDWRHIVGIYDAIDQLEREFEALDLDYLREIQQKQIILNLRKYAWTLQSYIIQKYQAD
jgi:hypothetical protein